MEIDDSREYKTRNSDLAAFLLFSGETLSSLVKEENVVYMIFEDPIGKCHDYERVFLNSDCKRYRDQHKWLLSKIHECLKGA